MWSGEQICTCTCRSCLGWYVVWRTDIYMSFMVRMIFGLENRYIHVVHVEDGMWSGEQIYTGRLCFLLDVVVIPTTSYVVVVLCCVV